MPRGSGVATVARGHMPSERVQRQIDRLLDEAEVALGRLDWPEVRARADAVLALDPQNADARTFRDARALLAELEGK